MTKSYCAAWLLVGGLALAQTPASSTSTVSSSVPRVADVPAAGNSSPSSDMPRSEDQQLEIKGDLHMARKSYREAIDDYAMLVRRNTSNAVAWNKMGIAYHQLLELDRARACYEKAAKLNRKYSEAVNNLGTIFYAQKNYRRAIRQYQQALTMAPNSASIHSNLGTALFARKKYPEAIEEYQKALQLDPEVFEHHNSYGVLLQERSVQDRAMFDFVMARIFAGGNNSEKALEHLRKALENGFRETKKIYEDPVFAELIKSPQFTELMANPPTAITR